MPSGTPTDGDILYGRASGISSARCVANLIYPRSSFTDARHIPVGRMTVKNVRAAIATAANRVEQDIDQLLRETQDWPVLSLFFLLWGRRPLTEKQFFGTIADRGMVEAVPDIRRLLVAYHAHYGARDRIHDQPWYCGDESIGPLGHAVRALVILDPDALETWEQYVEHRNEHESFSLTHFPAYAERHGWQDVRTFEAGTFAVVEWIKAGHILRAEDGSDQTERLWNKDGLLDEAEKRIEPDVFWTVAARRLASLDAHSANEKRVLTSFDNALAAKSGSPFFARVRERLQKEQA